MLYATETMTARTVAAYLEASGLKAPKPMTDDDVVAELNRRGLARRVVAAGISGAAATFASTDAEFANRLDLLADFVGQW